MCSKLLVFFCIRRRRGFHGYNELLHGFASRRWSLFLLWSEEVHHCSKCGTEFCRSGWRKRSVIASDGIPEIYWIRRLYCPKCRKIHHELPDFMIPFKRYCAQVLEDILEGAIQNTPCYDSTIRMIRHWFHSISEELLKLLEKQNRSAHENMNYFSSLQKIRKGCGNSKGWLSNAVMLLVKGGYYVKSTRFLC